MIPECFREASPIMNTLELGMALRNAGFVVCASLCMVAMSAQTVAPAAAEIAAVKEEKVKVASATLDDQLKGFGFAAGIAAVFMSGDGEVENAEVDAGGVLRVDMKSKDRLGGILETHYLWGDLLGGSARQQVKLDRVRRAIEAGRADSVSDFAPGIMVGAELGENAIRSLGIGIILSFRRLQVDGSGKLTPKVAFNLGAMAMIEQNVKMLADGLRDGQPLPAGLAAVRFKNDSRSGFAITFSAGF